MPIPSSIDDLSPTAGSNYPVGSDSPAIVDNVLREHASYIAQLRDTLAAGATEVLRRGRTVPHAVFNWFSSLFTVAQCQGPGQALLAQDIADVFQTINGGLMSGAVSYVRPTGSDSNDGSSWSSAFLTLGKALRNTSNGTIYIWPGSYGLSDFSHADTFGTLPKKVIAPFGGVTLRIAGDDISAATWTANGTYPNVWQTTLATTNRPVRVLVTNAQDQFGEPVPMPLGADLAAIDTSTFGWHYDSGTRVLSVRLGLENVNTVSKANLRAIYGDAATADNRTLLYSSISYWENITFHGYLSVLKVSGQATPQAWLKNCTFKYASTHALLVEGGNCYHQGCRVHRSTGDGANYNFLLATTPQAVEIDFRTECCGDVGTYGTSQTLNPISTGLNKNGSSNHDAFVIRVNGSHLSACGPAVADTAGSWSWCLGTKAGFSALAPNIAPGTPRYGILNQGNNAWLDGCSATGNDAGFNSDTSANVRTFNCFGSQSATNSGTFTAFIPS